MAKLDRAIANDDWRLHFEECAVHYLPKLESDRCPILISNTTFSPIPKALKFFRFQAAWILHERFEEFMYTTWKNDVPFIPFLKQFANSLS